MEAAWGCAPVETGVAFLWNEAVFETSVRDASGAKGATDVSLRGSVYGAAVCPAGTPATGSVVNSASATLDPDTSDASDNAPPA
jgi:hypothetical protein